MRARGASVPPRRLTSTATTEKEHQRTSSSYGPTSLVSYRITSMSPKPPWNRSLMSAVDPVSNGAYDPAGSGTGFSEKGA